MELKVRLGAAFLAGVMAGGLAAVPVERASAQGFFPGFYAPPQYVPPPGYGQPRYRAYGLQPYERQYRAPRWWGGGWGRRAAPAPVPTARVSSPRYYTYEPDQLKQVSLADLAEVRTVSAGPLGPQLDATPFAQARGYLADVTLRVLPEVGQAIKAHYARYPEFLWVDDGDVNDRARAAIAALGRADRFGLSPEDYFVELPAIAPGADDAARQKALVEFEVALSAKVLTYVLDATRGRIDPNRISGYHDFDRKKVDLAQSMLMIAAAADPGRWLESRHPSGDHFKALVAELARLQAEVDKAPAPIEIAEGTLLRPGDASPELANVVAAIRQVASESLKTAHAGTLAAYQGGFEYTPELVALVRDFQTEAGLRADGIVGRNTIAAMMPVTPAEKIAKVQLAMERARWLPPELGKRYVIINQPAFTATYVEEGKEPLAMKAVVGQKSNQTYFFMDKAEIVEYNPYWGVPRSIIVNEMMSRLYADPSYLDRLGYEVTNSAGRRISSSSVNWGAVAANQIGVDVRQPPGPSNALGLVKILFPNEHDIYMHDTPQKELFSRDVRAFSHGCVRLQAPRQMAAAVLGKSKEYVDSRIAEGRNAQEKIQGDVAVYVAYFTAWPTAEGDVEYFADIYDRDMYLTRAIERTNATRHAQG